MFGILDAAAAGGGQGLGNSSSGQQTQAIQLQDFNTLSRGQSQLEANTYQGMLGGYTNYQNSVAMGPGNQQISDALTGAYGYQNQLAQFAQNGGLPTQQQQQASQNFAQAMFAPQQTALQQSFIQQGQQNARLEAALGRSSMDPVLQAKLGISQTQQQAQLNAQQGAFAQQTAMNMPQQQMQFANQLYGVQQNLASQAFSNQQALMQMGNQLNNSERQYRLSTAFKNNEFGQTGYQQTGQGGFAGQVAGFQSGTGAEMGMIGGLLGGAGQGMSGAAKMGASF